MILRALKLKTLYFIVASTVSLAVLLPIYLKSEKGVNDINKFTAARLNQGSDVLWIYLIYYAVSVALVISFLFKEASLYIELKNRAMSDTNKKTLNDSTTIMVRGLSGKFLDPEYIKKSLSIIPGGVKNVSLSRNTSELEKIIKKRDCALLKLEDSLTKYIIKCKRHCDKFNKKMYSNTQKNFSTQITPPATPSEFIFLQLNSNKKRVLLQRVDSIRYYSRVLAYLNKEIKIFKNTYADGLLVNSTGFITFNKKIGAELALQVQLIKGVNIIKPKNICVNRDEVLWNNIAARSYPILLKFIYYICIFFVWLSSISATFFFTSLFNIFNFLATFNINADKFKFLAYTNATITAILFNLYYEAVPLVLRFFMRFRGFVRTTTVDFEILNTYSLILKATAFVFPLVYSSFLEIFGDSTLKLLSLKEILQRINDLTLGSCAISSRNKKESIITPVGLYDYKFSSEYNLESNELLAKQSHNTNKNKSTQKNSENCITFNIIDDSANSTGKLDESTPTNNKTCLPVFKISGEPPIPLDINDKVDFQFLDVDKSSETKKDLLVQKTQMEKKRDLGVNYAHDENHLNVANILGQQLNNEIDFKISENLYGKYGLHPKTDTDNYTQPPLLDCGYSNVWVPEDTTGLSDNLVCSLNEDNSEYFSILTTCAYVDRHYRVELDFHRIFRVYDLVTRRRLPKRTHSGIETIGTVEYNKIIGLDV
ncbi:hypothetical protein BB561_004053 [Smittium simulii]|uniref:CSC1/OSCA1-like cytosolic domain-containing protein n=1 Tax=Smittium simulii TaxID=133385 RepID=A0A2T9YIC4_9FUNG|nr:hypothetical protein BB561_004053 [Smittium simulii]